MTDTVNLGLPCIEGSQAQKHVTHNDALRILDTLVQLAVLDRDLTAPPGSPAEGQRWIVKATASGAWAGHDNAIAAWQDGAWQFSAPQTGWSAFVVDEGALLVWNGTAWGDFFSAVALQNLTLLGVGTTADANNPLSAKLNNTLFVAKTVAEGGDGNLRYKLSKESAAKTLSFLLQDNYSGRAEIGLTGDDDFHFKVSPDGATWYEGFKIAAATGKISFPVSGGPRETLTGNRTYYVRPDGSDSNNGLANTSGGAWLTRQYAYNWIVANLDQAGYQVTIQLADGTYSDAFDVTIPPCGGKVLIQGNTTTRDNVVISPSGACFHFNMKWFGPRVTIKSMKLVPGGSQSSLYGEALAHVGWNDINFGASGGSHIDCRGGSKAFCEGNYGISGGATSAHLSAGNQSYINTDAATVTLTGTPAFNIFAYITAQACLSAWNVTYSGAATGTRYSANTLGFINSFGGGANYFPGNSAGSTSTGGQYA